MERSLLIKLGVVAVVIIASLVLAIPPKDKIHLGLDLQGGLHLVLEVQVDKAVDRALERTAEAVRKDLRAKGVNVIAVEPREQRGLRLVFSQAPELSVVQEVVRSYVEAKVERQTPEVWTVDLPAAELQQIRTSAVDQALEKIRNRIDAFGVSEPSISKQGTNRIVVQLPGLKDPQRAIELIGKTAQLEFKLVQSRAATPDATPPAGSQRLFTKDKDPQTRQLVQGQAYFVDRRALLTGDMLADARALPDQVNFGQYYVLMRLNSRGQRIFARLTQENVGRALAIVLDDTIFSAPVIQEPILGGEARITGNFTPEEARDLAIVLREGALPAPVSIVENRIVGPSLGSDSIAQRGTRDDPGGNAGGALYAGILSLLRHSRQHRSGVKSPHPHGRPGAPGSRGSLNPAWYCWYYPHVGHGGGCERPHIRTHTGRATPRQISACRSGRGLSSGFLGYSGFQCYDCHSRCCAVSVWLRAGERFCSDVDPRYCDKYVHGHLCQSCDLRHGLSATAGDKTQYLSRLEDYVRVGSSGVTHRLC